MARHVGWWDVVVRDREDEGQKGGIICDGGS